jgi:hypothetical protein
MKGVAVLLAGVLAPGLCFAQESAPFARVWTARTLVGVGSVPRLPSDDRTGNFVMTAEVGHHPFPDGKEGGALCTGFSLSSATDFYGLWHVVTPGLFAKLDLTYIFLSGLWAYPLEPDERNVPFRAHLGGRLGLGISESSRPAAEVPYASQYLLIRPELLSFVDLEVPLGSERVWSLVARGGVDTGVNLGTVFRWSVSAGLDYGWDR